MAYLGWTDLLARWTYTRRGLEKARAREDFPEPAFVVNRGRTPVWDHRDIETYETAHPEMTSAAAKRRKVAGYAAANLKKAAREA